ncbi:cell division control protein 48 [Ophiostoma piceae UAMH 11346]|uniref:Cell division control protein 48 n=1 Tax=Ophiostoma piceae (strain UAMH 11346) TaxID=1262450 RepID=S3C6Y6_OPHP1|nr:cell division control protein 48 [Ophiostoma piceae UAMH 11346]
MSGPSGSPSCFVRNTRSRADLKSAICTRIRRSRSAIRPASEQIALMSAPDRSSFCEMNSSRSTSSFSDILDVCSVKILRFVFWSGFSNRILRSIRPGRISAGSSDSILFVAMITLTSPRSSKPSSWFRSSSIVRWTSRSPPDVESYRFVPMASISSMKTIDGAFSAATWNSCRTNRGPSPRYFWISSLPTILRNVADVWLATALASSVLPVPGAPYRMTPLGGLMPISS